MRHAVPSKVPNVVGGDVLVAKQIGGQRGRASFALYPLMA